MDYSWYDFLGNIGVVLILLTYLLLQAVRMAPTALLYSLSNGLGALLIMVSLLYNYNLSAMIIESAWLLISMYGVARALRRMP